MILGIDIGTQGAQALLITDGELVEVAEAALIAAAGLLRKRLRARPARGGIAGRLYFGRLTRFLDAVARFLGDAG